MLKILIIFSAFLLRIAFAQSNCNITCKTEFKHYKELGCRPMLEKSQCCPQRYECPEVTDQEYDKCYYQGTIYENGHSLPSSALAGMCIASCRCSDHKSPASFVCAHIDCAEFFVPSQPECIRQYAMNTCCSVGTVCGDDRANLHVCHIDGEKYLDGQKMYPKSAPCFNCLCSTEFDNTTYIADNPHCWEINCGTELRNLDTVKKGCIPIYFGRQRCCPIAWRCPDDKDVVIPHPGKPKFANNPRMKCKFGYLTMHIGDTISTEDKCVTCKCTIPPMAHCIRRNDCH